MPFWSSSYMSFSSSVTASRTHNGETQNWGQRNAREVFRDEDNSRHERKLSQKLGEDAVYEERHFDSEGRQLIDDGSEQRLQQQQQQPQDRRIEDVTDKK